MPVPAAINLITRWIKHDNDLLDGGESEVLDLTHSDYKTDRHRNAIVVFLQSIAVNAPIKGV